jgi:hypothetical protein
MDKWNQIVHWKLYHPLGDWQPTTKQNFGIKLGSGYEEAKFNYLNNSQFSWVNISPTTIILKYIGDKGENFILIHYTGLYIGRA